MPVKNGRPPVASSARSRPGIAGAREGTRGAAALPAAALARVLLADAESGILILDPEARIHAINPAAMRMFALSGRAPAGRPAADLLHALVPGDDLVGSGYRSARTERETVIAGPGGGEIPVLIRTERLGRPPWLVMTVRDLTHARRMHEELRRHERLATLGRLAAGVAHEIRNPLAGIGTSAQVLLRRFEPRDERARFVRVILEEVERLDRIVTSLLQYARPRTPVLAAGDLGACVQRVRELAAEPISQAGVVVETEIVGHAGTIFIDADLMTQVLLNVTLNAVQAMPRGGTLRYEVRRVRRRQAPRGPGRRREDTKARRLPARAAWLELVQVRVTDTGVGMPAGVLQQLFDPFFTTKSGGTGLGMSISQTIMQEHGGTIEVASREGHGTTVLLSLPVEKRHGERREFHPDSERAHPARRR